MGAWANARARAKGWQGSGNKARRPKAAQMKRPHAWANAAKRSM